MFNSSEKRPSMIEKRRVVLRKRGKASFDPKMIGTTRSRVSFFMNRVRKLGYIEYNGTLEIRNSLLNIVLYDKSEIKTKDASNGPK